MNSFICIIIVTDVTAVNVRKQWHLNAVDAVPVLKLTMTCGSCGWGELWQAAHWSQLYSFQRACLVSFWNVKSKFLPFHCARVLNDSFHSVAATGHRWVRGTCIWLLALLGNGLTKPAIFSSSCVHSSALTFTLYNPAASDTLCNMKWTEDVLVWMF